MAEASTLGLNGYIKILSVNINGSNSSTKSMKTFNHLKKQKIDILSLQESHIKKKQTF